MNIQNQVQLVGRLSANPEVKLLDNGNKLARFAIAINESFINKKGEKIKNTQWHTITAWGSLATAAQRMLCKGTQVTIGGKLVNRTYTSKDGLKRVSTEIIANELFVAYQKS